MAWNNKIRWIYVVAGWLFTIQPVLGQTNRYIVHFTDKEGSPFSIDRPEEFLSSQAIERRDKQGISIVEEDLPVNAFYIDSISNLNIPTYFKSKWFNAVLVESDVNEIGSIESFSFVSNVEYVGPGAKLNSSSVYNSNERKWNFRIQGKKTDATSVQNELLGLDVLHANGYTGSDISIAIMDGGFIKTNKIRFFDHLYTESRVKHTFDFVTGQEDIYKYTEHGTMVFSLLAAYDEDIFVGAAYDADYYLFVTEDNCGPCEHRVEEYNWVFAAEFADSAGVDVINTSLGYNIFEDPAMSYSYEDMDGESTVISRASTIAASKGILVVTSAGNEGNLPWKYITAPGDAKNVVTIGNVDANGDKVSSSSFGPTFDGRIKPDFVAMGSGVKVVNSSGLIVPVNGTSFSSPLVAGLLATSWQAHPDLTAEEMVFYYKQTASNASDPNNEIGYGIPNFEALDILLSVSELPMEFTVYPNPVFNDRLVIRANYLARSSKVDVIIYNISGQKLIDSSISFQGPNDSQIIEMATFKSGVYIVHLNTGSNIHKIRIVKI